MAGSAKVRAVLSTATSRTGNISRDSASQSRHGARGADAARRCQCVCGEDDVVLMTNNYTVQTVQLRNPAPDRHDGTHAQKTRCPRSRPGRLRIPADRRG